MKYRWSEQTMERGRYNNLAVAAVATLVAGGAVLAATLTGTDRSDKLQGTAENDTIYGKGADDRLEGLLGDDTIYGGDGNDELIGGAEGQATGSDNDYLLGELGDDYMAGGPGADRLYGGGGADMIQGGLDDSAQDTVDGGDGDDVIDVADTPASKDVVQCGAGVDQVSADYLDVVGGDCETVNPAAVSETEVYPADPGDPSAESGDAVAASVGPYYIRSWWPTRLEGWVPLREGRHNYSTGGGFGKVHIEAKRGWNAGIKWRMFMTLKYGREEYEPGPTAYKRAWMGPGGCVWRSIYDLRQRNDIDGRRMGIITFYDDWNNPNCPNYRS